MTPEHPEGPAPTPRREPAPLARPPAPPVEPLEELGRGTFGITVKARVNDPYLIGKWRAKIVALKIPMTRDAEDILVQEVLNNSHLRGALTGLQDVDNLVAFYDVRRFSNIEWFDNGECFVMVMEFVPDGSLWDRMHRPMDIDRILALADGIAAGLAAVHRAGILHRDLKPNNILMSGDTPKLADFGLSGVLRHREQLLSVVGTPSYRAPEIILGRGGSYPADVYSAGVTLYELLTGYLPFDPAERIFDTVPVRPVQRRPDTPEWLDAVIVQALARDPHDRFADGDALARALHPERELANALAEIAALITGPDPGRPADDAIDRLLARFPRSSEVFDLQGELRSHRLDHAGAIASFTSAIQLAPTNPRLHWALALAHKGHGDSAAMVASLEDALRLGLEPPLDAHARRFLTLARSGQL